MVEKGQVGGSPFQVFDASLDSTASEHWRHFLFQKVPEVVEVVDGFAVPKELENIFNDFWAVLQFEFMSKKQHQLVVDSFFWIPLMKKE